MGFGMQGAKCRVPEEVLGYGDRARLRREVDFADAQLISGGRFGVRDQGLRVR